MSTGATAPRAAEQDNAATHPSADAGASRRGRVKCVVWDLDNTLWDGILMEDDKVTVRPQVIEVIRGLDEAGILHSIASRNDHEAAMTELRRAGIDHYFLCPQINWSPKPSSIHAILQALNIGADAIAFVDDQPFERAAVAYALPQVLCVDIADLHATLRQPELQPRFVTDESRTRRQLYRNGIRRGQAEEEFVGTDEEFLATLGMAMAIARAGEDDLKRAEELTVRTNQLNSTGFTYSFGELDRLRTSAAHILLVASLNDRFGSYGKIGLALLERCQPAWYLRLLLMSCRVVSRGVGTVLLNHVMSLAKTGGAAGLRANFVETGRNRLMYVTFKFAGFREVHRNGQQLVLESDLQRVQPVPDYLTLRLE